MPVQAKKSGANVPSAKLPFAIDLMNSTALAFRVSRDMDSFLSIVRGRFGSSHFRPSSTDPPAGGRLPLRGPPIEDRTNFIASPIRKCLVLLALRGARAGPRSVPDQG